MTSPNESGPGAVHAEAAETSVPKEESELAELLSMVPRNWGGVDDASAEAPPDSLWEQALSRLEGEAWLQLDDAASLARRLGVPFQATGAGLAFEACPSCAARGATLALNYLWADGEYDDEGEPLPDARWDLLAMLHPAGEAADERCTSTDVARALVSGDLPRPVAAAAAEVLHMDQLMRWHEGQAEMPALPLADDEGPGERGSRLVSAGERRNRPEPVWAVEGLMPEWGVGQLFGASYTGKTYVALDLALSVANGLDAWAGREIRRPGPVVYVAMEGVFDLAARVRAWLGAHEGCTDDALFTLEEEAVDLASAESVGLLRQDMELAGIRPALIVVDTQSLATPGTDENSNSEMNRVFAHLKALASELRCPVMLVHHTGHAAQDRSRGASAIFAALDFQFRVSEHQLKAIKVKAGQEQGPWGFNIRTGEHGSAYAAIGGEGNAAVLGAVAREGLEWERREAADRIWGFALEHREVTAAEVAAMLGESARNATRRLDQLVEDGRLERIPGGMTGQGREPTRWRTADA